MWFFVHFCSLPSLLAFSFPFKDGCKRTAFLYFRRNEKYTFCYSVGSPTRTSTHYCPNCSTYRQQGFKHKHESKKGWARAHNPRRSRGKSRAQNLLSKCWLIKHFFNGFLTALFWSYSLLVLLGERRLPFLTLLIQHNIITASWYELQHLLHLPFWESSGCHSGSWMCS